MTEANDAIAWSKARPLAGTRDKWRELALSRGPHGEVFLFWYDEPTQIFAARAWTHEGGIFADFQVLTVEGCEATAVLYWPGHGWIAVLLYQGSLHAQLLGEGGTLKWSGNGVTARVTAPRGTRPKIGIASGKDVEIAIGTRKVKINADGALL